MHMWVLVEHFVKHAIICTDFVVFLLYHLILYGITFASPYELLHWFRDLNIYSRIWMFAMPNCLIVDEDSKSGGYPQDQVHNNNFWLCHFSLMRFGLFFISDSGYILNIFNCYITLQFYVFTLISRIQHALLYSVAQHSVRVSFFLFIYI